MSSLQHIARAETPAAQLNPIPQLPVHPATSDPELAAAPLLSWVPFAGGNPMWIPPELAAAISKHLYRNGFRLEGQGEPASVKRWGWLPW